MQWKRMLLVIGLSVKLESGMKLVKLESTTQLESPVILKSSLCKGGGEVAYPNTKRVLIGPGRSKVVTGLADSFLTRALDHVQL